jgi:hypothetical protein
MKRRNFFKSIAIAPLAFNPHIKESFNCVRKKENPLQDTIDMIVYALRGEVMYTKYIGIRYNPNLSAKRMLKEIQKLVDF